MSWYRTESLEKSRCKTVWMGPIPKNTSKRQILDFFKDYNPLECKIIEKTSTNRFAFIYFPDETSRDNAIQGKKGCLFRGENVVVNRSFNAYTGEKLGGRMRIEDDFIDCLNGYDGYDGYYYFGGGIKYY